MARMCHVDRAVRVVLVITASAILYNIPRFLEIINPDQPPTGQNIDYIYILTYKTWMYCALYAVAPLMILLVTWSPPFHAQCRGVFDGGGRGGHVPPQIVGPSIQKK